MEEKEIDENDIPSSKTISDSKSFSDIFMELAINLYNRAGDNESKIGCVITNIENQILSFGYNGEVKGSDISYITQNKQNKEKYIVHAEMNALSHCITNLYKEQLIIYTTRLPCEICMKLLCQYNIICIFYLFKRNYIGTFEMAKNRNILLINYKKLVNFPMNIDKFETKYPEKTWCNTIIEIVDEKIVKYDIVYKNENNDLKIISIFIQLNKYIFQKLIDMLKIKNKDILFKTTDVKYTPTTYKYNKIFDNETNYIVNTSKEGVKRTIGKDINF